MRRTQTLVLPLLLLGFGSSLGCLPTHISGASAPTEHTFQLTDADIAYVEQDACAQTWVTGNSADDLALAHAKLKDRDVKIKPGNFIATATALRTQLRVADDFDDRTDAEQAAILSHELVHYCQRDEQGDTAFEESYFHSAGRWRAEVPAYMQTYRTMLMQCVPISIVAAKIDKRVTTMRDTYLLWNIEPAMYETKTREILRSVLDVPDHCMDD